MSNPAKIKGNLSVTGDVTCGDVECDSVYSLGGLEGASIDFGAAFVEITTLSKADSYALDADEKTGVLLLTASEASKVFTLGFDAGQIAIVKNAGATNAFTVKNIATDTGTSLATGKSLLVIGSTTKDASTVIALD